MFYMDLISLIGLSESRKRYIKYVESHSISKFLYMLILKKKLVNQV